MKKGIKSVELSPPINMAETEKHLFIPFSSYEKPFQKIKRLKNVFIGYSGFCLDGDGLIPECHHNYSAQIDHYYNEAARFYYEATDRPENLITLDDDNVYLAIHHPWFNYYHWVCESLFRLWMVRKNLEQLTLILPDHYKNADFIMGSLKPFHIKKIFFIPLGKSLLVKNLCLPQIKPKCDSYNTRHVNQIRQFYRDYVINNEELKVDEIERIYVSREFAGRRKIVNEEEVIRIIKNFGFKIFHPEKFSFLEQVAIFSKAKYLIGTHGSGLTNMLFMESKTSVLELHKNETNELDHPSPLFWYLSDALGIKYHHQSCETFGQKDYFEGDYSIDVALLERNLITMLKD